jgi:hypothetical protein
VYKIIPDDERRCPQAKIQTADFTRSIFVFRTSDGKKI